MKHPLKFDRFGRAALRLEPVARGARFGKPDDVLAHKGVRAVSDNHFDLNLPEEVVAAFGWNEGEVPTRVQEALVMELLRRDRLSEAQASALLRLNRWELLELMGRHNVPAVRLSAEELEKELSSDVRRHGRQ